MKHFATLLIISLFISAPVYADVIEEQSVIGHWVTEGGDGIVEIKICDDAKLCGISKWVDPKRGVSIDSKNPDKTLRGRTLAGSKIIWGLEPKGQRWSGGKIYNPKDGNTYVSKLRLTEDGSLKVKGCVGPICKSMIWTRAKNPKAIVMTSVSAKP